MGVIMKAGCYTAIITPFKNNAVDYEGLEKLADFQIQNGITGIQLDLKIEGIDAEHHSGAWLRIGYSLRLLKKGKQGIAALEKAAAMTRAPAAVTSEG